MKIVIDKERLTWRKLRDELVLMSLDTGAYYSLNETGILIWQALVDDRPHAEILKALVETYDVEMDTARGDFERLVNELADQGLVELVDEKVQS